MSQPKRYFLKISQTISGLRADVYEAENGEFVDYEDYARLKAEIERLRKAGDAICESPFLYEADPAVIEWRNAAKEVQS